MEGASGTVGVQWGFFVAFIAAGLLALAGSRVRAAHHPEPRSDPDQDSSGHDDTERTRPMPVRRRTARSAQPAEVPRPADPPPYVPAARDAGSGAGRAARRPGRAPSPPDRLF